MTLVGIANMMIQLTLYPNVNYIVNESTFGTAYGIIEACCNIGHILGSLIIGTILNTLVDIEESECVDIGQFQTVHLYLISLSALSVLLCIKLVRFDSNANYGKNVLNKVFKFPENTDDSNSFDISDASIGESLEPLKEPLLDQAQQDQRALFLKKY